MNLKDLYREMSELTNPICGACDPPYHCCELAGCEKARAFARAIHGIQLFNVIDGPLPFLSEYGCTVAVHLRPLCTTWLCLDAIDRGGIPKRYWELRAEIVRLESERWKKKFPI